MRLQSFLNTHVAASFPPSRAMKLSSQDLSEIAARASTLTERLSGQFMSITSDPALAERRLARWKRVSAGDDVQRFAHVLQSVGGASTEESILLSLLGNVKSAPGVPLPAWTNFLAALVEDVSRQFDPQSTPTSAQSPNPRRDSLPFAEIHQAFAEAAWRQVMSAYPASMLLPEAARRGLQRYLMRRLSGITSVALHSIFLAHKALANSFVERSPFQMRPKVVTPDHPQRLYRAFVRSQGEEGLRSFFLLHPVAARLAAEVTMLWIEFVGEFLVRLKGDGRVLSQSFNAGQSLGAITAVQAGVSDPHHGGRTVVILRFKSGLRLVYKPRPMSVDALFIDLVRQINVESRKLALYTPKIVDRGNYGWMEFVRHVPCTNRQAAKRFYRRAGSLACLLHWLQGVDCHRDNLIAAGEHPVLVDLESLGHPLGTEETSDLATASPWLLAASALRTGLLPFWQLRPRGKSLYDNTGLGAPIRQRPLIGSTHWKNLRSDQVDWQFAERPQKHSAHRPRWENQHFTVKSHSADVLSGFRSMATLLTDDAHAKFGDTRLQIYGAVRRWVKRPTVVYTMLLRRSLRADALIEGVDRSLTLQGLPIDSASAEDRRAEIGSLERLDIPYFRINTPSIVQRTCVAQPWIGTRLREQMEVIRASLDRKLVLVEGRLEPLAPGSRK